MRKGVHYSPTREQASHWYESRVLLWLSTPLAVVAFLAVVSFGYAQMLEGKIYPGVQVGSLALGGMKIADAEEAVEDFVTTYQQQPLVIRYGTETWTPEIDDLGVSIDIRQTLVHAFNSGRASLLGKWFVPPVHAGSDDRVLAGVVVHEPEFDAYLDWLAAQVDEAPEQPVLQMSGTSLQFAGGTLGSTVDRNLLKAQLMQQLLRLQEVDVSVSLTATEPLSDASVMEELTEEAALLLVDELQLKGDDEVFTIQPQVLSKWISVTETEKGWRLALQRDSTEEYLTELLAGLGKAAKPEQRYESVSPSKAIVEGEDGRAVAMDRLLDLLSQQWLQKRKTEIEIPFQVVQHETEYLEVTAPRSEGKVLYTDLDKQTMFAFEDGVLQYYTLMSSGKPWTPTVPGEFKVYTKVRRQVMSGPGYYLPNVEWVMYYNGDYGIHSAYWHNNFGHPMSHGCSNLPTEAAQWMYEFAEVGTPVIIVGETPRS